MKTNKQILILLLFCLIQGAANAAPPAEPQVASLGEITFYNPAKLQTNGAVLLAEQTDAFEGADYYLRGQDLFLFLGTFPLLTAKTNATGVPFLSQLMLISSNTYFPTQVYINQHLKQYQYPSLNDGQLTIYCNEEKTQLIHFTLEHKTNASYYRLTWKDSKNKDTKNIQLPQHLLFVPNDLNHYAYCDGQILYYDDSRQEYQPGKKKSVWSTGIWAHDITTGKNIPFAITHTGVWLGAPIGIPNTDYLFFVESRVGYRDEEGPQPFYTKLWAKKKLKQHENIPHENTKEKNE